MTDSRRIVGDCREVLRKLIEDGVKVQMCVTSPPYWGLRDYGTGTWEGGDGSECEHARPYGQGRPRPDLPNPPAGWAERDVTVRTAYNTCAKCGARRVDKQIGLEKNHDCAAWARGAPLCGECHVCVIVEVFRLVREVLADDGVLFLNYGDSYANANPGTGGATPKQATNAGSFHEGAKGRKLNGLKPKDLVGMPWRVALALQADGWWLRSDIIWSKPNPMPESCTDRPTKSHEYLFLLAKRANYFYDAEAVREANSPTSCGNRRTFRTPAYTNGNSFHNSRKVEYDIKGNSGELSGRNRRSVWEIATEPFAEAHFATFPKALISPAILAGTSQRGHCPAIITDPKTGKERECGARWVRVVERGDEYKKQLGKGAMYRYVKGGQSGDGVVTNARTSNKSVKPDYMTTGWRPTCECGYKPIPDVCLDPFGGSGTVGAVAEQLGRKWILIDLSEDYAAMQKKRTAQTGMAL